MDGAPNPNEIEMENNWSNGYETLGTTQSTHASAGNGDPFNDFFAQNPQTILGGDFNFDLLFGVNDFPLDTVPTIDPLEKTSSTPQLPLEAHSTSYSANDTSFLRTASLPAFCSPVCPRPADQPITSYFLESICHCATTQKVCACILWSILLLT